VERPVVTGAKFGFGFAVVFALISFSLEYANMLLIDSLYPEGSFKDPQIVRAEPVVRDGVFVVLATVRSVEDTQMLLFAEAVLYDSNDEFIDTCDADRSFELPQKADLSFVATCSVGPDYVTSSGTQVARAGLQFH